MLDVVYRSFVHEIKMGPLMFIRSINDNKKERNISQSLIHFRK